MQVGGGIDRHDLLILQLLNHDFALHGGRLDQQYVQFTDTQGAHYYFSS
jgi:hypothetical protein